MNLDFERDALKEAVCNSRALYHGWALAYRIARPSKGGVEAIPPHHDLLTSTTCITDATTSLSSLPYAVKQRCETLLQPFTNPCPSDAEDNAGRPLIFLRSNPTSDVVFLLHPTAARYSKLLFDLVEMIEEMGEDFDEEDMIDAENSVSYDTSRVSLADLMPFDIASIREACCSREEETRRSEQQQQQQQQASSDGACTRERKEDHCHKASREFPAADVCRSSTVLADASDFADDWRSFYTEHSVDAALHTFEPRQLSTFNSANTKVESNSSLAAESRGNARASSDGHDVAELFQSQLISFLKKKEYESSKPNLQGGPSSATTRRRPRPIVVDVLGYDNAVLAVIAAFSHSLVMSHHDLATRGNLQNPASTLGWGKGNLDEFEQEEGPMKENVKREPEITGRSAEVASTQSGSSSSLITQKLAFTKPQKPAKSLLITSFYGNCLGPKVVPEVSLNFELRERMVAAMESSGRHLGLGGLTSSNLEQRRLNSATATLATAMRSSLPYLPYEAVTARHYLLPFVGNYRRPFNFEIGGEKTILKMLLEKASSGGGLSRLPVPSEFRTVAFMILLSEKKAKKLAAERAVVASSRPILSNSTAFVLVGPPPPPPPRLQTEPEPTPPPQQSFIPGRDTCETAHALSREEESSGQETEAALLSPSQKISSPSSPSLPAAEDSDHAGNDTTLEGCSQKHVYLSRPRPEGYVTLDVLEDPAAARPALKKLYETETNALVDAISRASSVMNAANFLQMTPLIELCGLSLAMIMRGRSLEESRELFAASVNYTCLDEE